MSEDDLIFLGGSILLAHMVGQKRAPADELEIHVAMGNALKLREEVKKISQNKAASAPLGLHDYEKSQGLKR